MYFAGLDIHDILRKSPVSHAQGVESIMWLTTLAGVVRAARRARKGKTGSNHCHMGRHGRGLPSTTTDTGVAPPAGENIGEEKPLPLLLKVLSPLAHGAIILTPTVYLVSTVIGRMEQQDWFRDWELPDHELTQGKFAILRVTAAVANYSLLYLLKRVSKAVDAAARFC